MRGAGKSPSNIFKLKNRVFLFIEMKRGLQKTENRNDLSDYLG